MIANVRKGQEMKNKLSIDRHFGNEWEYSLKCCKYIAEIDL